MIICVCCNISESKVKEHKGTLKEFAHITGCTKRCGSCRKYVKQIIDGSLENKTLSK